MTANPEPTLRASGNQRGAFAGAEGAGGQAPPVLFRLPDVTPSTADSVPGGKETAADASLPPLPPPPAPPTSDEGAPAPTTASWTTSPSERNPAPHPPSSKVAPAAVPAPAAPEPSLPDAVDFTAPVGRSWMEMVGSRLILLLMLAAVATAAIVATRTVPEVPELPDFATDLGEASAEPPRVATRQTSPTGSANGASPSSAPELPQGRSEEEILGLGSDAAGEAPAPQTAVEGASPDSPEPEGAQITPSPADRSPAPAAGPQGNPAASAPDAEASATPLADRRQSDPALPVLPAAGPVSPQRPPLAEPERFDEQETLGLTGPSLSTPKSPAEIAADARHGANLIYQPPSDEPPSEELPSYQPPSDEPASESMTAQSIVETDRPHAPADWTDYLDPPGSRSPSGFDGPAAGVGATAPQSPSNPWQSGLTGNSIPATPAGNRVPLDALGIGAGSAFVPPAGGAAPGGFPQGGPPNYAPSQGFAAEPPQGPPQAYGNQPYGAPPNHNGIPSQASSEAAVQNAAGQNAPAHGWGSAPGYGTAPNGSPAPAGAGHYGPAGAQGSRPGGFDAYRPGQQAAPGYPAGQSLGGGAAPANTAGYRNPERVMQGGYGSPQPNYRPTAPAQARGYASPYDQPPQR